METLTTVESNTALSTQTVGIAAIASIKNNAALTDNIVNEWGALASIVVKNLLEIKRIIESLLKGEIQVSGALKRIDEIIERDTRFPGIREHICSMIHSTFNGLLLCLETKRTTFFADQQGRQRVESTTQPEIESIKCHEALSEFDDVEAVRKAIQVAIEQIFTNDSESQKTTSHALVKFDSASMPFQWERLKIALEHALENFDSTKRDPSVWKINHNVKLQTTDIASLNSVLIQDFSKLQGIAEALKEAKLACIEEQADIRTTHVEKFLANIAPFCTQVLDEADMCIQREKKDTSRSRRRMILDNLKAVAKVLNAMIELHPTEEIAKRAQALLSTTY